MTRMRNRRLTLGTLAFLALGGLTFRANLRAQAPSSASGSIEFQARIRPTGGQLEPVRSLSFYLLRKSVADIRQEAEQTSHRWIWTSLWTVWAPRRN